MTQQPQDEFSRIVGIMHNYLTEEKLKELLIKLDEEIGKKSNNLPTKNFLISLRNTVDKPLPSPSIWLWIAFYALVVVHMLICFGVVGSFFILPIYAPWYIATPVMTFIWFFSTTRVDCQLTNLENAIREKLRMKKIGGFVGHYFLKPTKLFLLKRKLRRA